MNKIDELCEYLDDNVLPKDAISNKELSQSTDYIKNGYLRMLAVILQQSSNVTDGQLKMFKRILKGVQSDKTAEEYMKKALEIEIDDYEKFSNEIRNLKLKYRWVLDAIILSCTQIIIPEQLKLIAHCCESFDIDKSELKYIATMARAIVEMNVNQYVNAFEIKVDNIPDTIFSEYMYLISKESVLHNEHMTIFQPSCKEDVTVQILNKIENVNTPCVMIIGADIDLASYQLEFYEKEKVILEDCHIIGSKEGDYPLNFSNVEKVIINNCTFEEFNTSAIQLDCIVDTLIKGCTFNVCVTETPNSIIYVIEEGSINLINTKFFKCMMKRSAYASYTVMILANGKCLVDNCCFEKCWKVTNFTDDNNYLLDTSGRLFTADSVASNCTYKDSAPFN